MSEEKISFEEACEKLETAVKNISNDQVSLEDAIENYRQGKKYYETCSRILSEARQLIEIYDRETDSVKEMQ